VDKFFIKIIVYGSFLSVYQFKFKSTLPIQILDDFPLVKSFETFNDSSNIIEMIVGVIIGVVVFI